MNNRHENSISSLNEPKKANVLSSYSIGPNSFFSFQYTLAHRFSSSYPSRQEERKRIDKTSFEYWLYFRGYHGWIDQLDDKSLILAFIWSSPFFFWIPNSCKRVSSLTIDLYLIRRENWVTKKHEKKKPNKIETCEERQLLYWYGQKRRVIASCWLSSSSEKKGVATRRGTTASIHDGAGMTRHVERSASPIWTIVVDVLGSLYACRSASPLSIPLPPKDLLSFYWLK